jgi:hypothetical protein
MAPVAPPSLNLAVLAFVSGTSGPGGSLTLTLNGQVLAVWDATDSRGQVVPNGFYHLILTQTFTDGTQIVLNRGVYVDPYSQATEAQMLVGPNVVHPGATVEVSGQVEGNPVEGAGVFKVYALDGELLKTLDAVNGQASWDLTTREGKQVASGLYLIVMNVMDPKTNSPATKTAKVAVLR